MTNHQAAIAPFIRQSGHDLPSLKRGYKKEAPPFSVEERIALAELMQQIVLDEIGRVMAWRPSQCALRGGGALHYGYGSARMSDDLNFLVAFDRMAHLIKAMPRISGRIRNRLTGVAGGVARISSFLRDIPEYFGGHDTQEGGFDRILAMEILWSHANRSGHTKVDVEFYPTPNAALALYPSEPVLVSLALTRSAGQMAVLASRPVALLADKLLSVARRPNLKWRDLFDIGFIVANTREFHTLHMHDKVDALRVATNVQRQKFDDLGESLRVRLVEIAAAMNRRDRDKFSAYEIDLRNWFDLELFSAMHQTGLLKNYVEHAIHEIQLAIVAIRNSD